MIPANEILYETECVGNQFCEIRFQLISENDLVDCIEDYTGNRNVNDLLAIKENYAMFFEYQCDIETVDLYYYGPIERHRLANIVIACDAIICLIWVFNTIWLTRSYSVE